MPIREIPRTARKYRIAVLFCWAIIVLFFGALSFTFWAEGQTVYLGLEVKSVSNGLGRFYFGFAGFFAALSVLGLTVMVFFNHEVRSNCLLAGIISALSILSAETFLELKRTASTGSWLEESRPLKKSENHVGLSNAKEIDDRSKLDVIHDYETAGTVAFPNIHPKHLLSTDARDGLAATGQVLFPLANISGNLIVQKNEGGYWLSYRTDRYGFHNEDRNWDGDTDLVMIGDSYAEGWVVRSKDNIASILSRKGLRVVNLGKAGNGPLLELASLVEYGLGLDPRVVLWVYFENDIESDLLWEWKSRLLRRYLEPGFNQGLITKQNMVDQVLIQRTRMLKKQHAQDRVLLSTKNSEQELPRRSFKDFSERRVLKLSNLREALMLTPQDKLRKILFRKVIFRTKALLSDSNTKLYFVYLPSGNALASGRNHRWRSFVLNTVRAAGITTIDAQEEVFEGTPDITVFFPFGNVSNHYNETGYRLLAERIWYRIGQDFEQFLD